MAQVERSSEEPPQADAGAHAATTTELARSVGKSIEARVFVGVLAVFLALIPPGMYGIDANSMFEVAESLATSFDFSIPCGEYTTNQNGECYSPFYPLQSVLAAPLVLFGLGLGALVDLPASYVAKVLALILPAIATAGASAFTAGIALRLGSSRAGAVAAAAAFAFGTEALAYGRTFFAEPLAAFLLALAVWSLMGRRAQWLGYLALGLAILVKPTMIVPGVAIVVAFAAINRQPRTLLAGGTALALGALLFLVYNWALFGGPLEFAGGGRLGQDEGASLGGDDYFGSKAAEGLGRLLISPGRGLIWMSPVVVLGAWALWRRRTAPAAASALAALVGLLALHSGFPGNGFEWATRYLLPVLPLLCAGLALLPRRSARVAAVLALVGLLVALPTTFAFWDRWEQEAERIYGVEQQDVPWAWPPMPQTRIWPAAINQVRDAVNSDPERLVQSSGGPRASTVGGQELLRVVALWWWMLPVVGIPWWLGAALSCAAIAWGAVVLWRTARSSTSARAGPVQAAGEPGPA